MLEDGSVVPLDESAVAEITDIIDVMAAKALRCLAFARKEDLGQLVRLLSKSNLSSG